MLPVERRTATMDLLAARRAISVENLAERLAVSLSTVRRDLDELERAGAVRRVHGGAVLRQSDLAGDAPEQPPATREIEHADAKQAIARRAVQLVAPGTAVLVTGGTTTAALVPLLAGVPDITVITNSLDVAARLAHPDTHPGLDLIVLGGALRRPELSLLGSLVGLGLDELHVDHALMGVYGIDPRSGLLGASAAECETDRRVVRSAAHVTVLADPSKFARSSPHRIATIGALCELAISELVTTADAPPAEVSALRDQGLTVHLAGR